MVGREFADIVDQILDNPNLEMNQAISILHLFDIITNLSDEEIETLESKSYNLEDKTLNNKERINYELKKLIDILEINQDKSLEELEETFIKLKQLSYKNRKKLDLESVKSLKTEINLIQLSFGLVPTFPTALVETLTKYFEDNKETKKEKLKMKH